MIIRQVTDHIITMFLLADGALAEQSLCDEALANLKNGLGYEVPNKSYVIHGFYQENNELIACFVSRMLTDCCVEWHPFLATKHQNTGTIKEIQSLFISALKTQTKCTSMFTSAPKCCLHSHKAALKHGWKHIGTLPNSITWRDELQDLNLYSQEI